MKLTEWAIRNARPVFFLTAILCVVGAFLYTTFPVSILPDVAFPRVVIVAEAGDRPAKSVEVAITRPIEEALATLPGVSRVRSTTERGSAEISVDFAAGTDIVAAESQVNAKVGALRANFPPETTTEVQRMNPTVFPVVGLTVNSKSLTPTELWSLATYTLRPRLSRVPGVARVIVQGGNTPEMDVTVRPAALAAGLSLDDVVQAITNANSVLTVGRLDRRYQQFAVTVDGETTTPEAIGEIVVTQKGGAPIRVRQVADVRNSVADRTTVVSANGSESVLINLVRQPSANTVAMAEAVRQAIASMRKELPSDVEIGTFYDQSILVGDAVGGVRDAVGIGAILSVVVLMLFLGNVRATLVTAAIIPITLLITFVLMRLAGLTLNLMTLGALAVGIGLVIDDAIVVVEAVFQSLGDSASVPEAVQRASSLIAAPMVSSTLTTVVVFLPLSFLEGVAGAFFSALAVTLSIALIVSLALALCVSPTLCAVFLRRDSAKGEGKFFHAVLRGYERVLSTLLRRKWIVVPIIVATVAATAFFATRLDTGFMPTMDEGAFVLDYRTPPGTSLAESDRLLRKVDQILLATPDIATFSRRTGTELGFAITEPNRGDYAVMLKEHNRRPIEDVIAEVRGKVDDLGPGLDPEFIQVLQDLIGDLAGSSSPIEVKLYGEDKAQVEAVANDLADRLGKVDGLADVQSGIIEAGPEIRLKLDPGLVGRVGMTTETVASQAQAAMLGTVATQVLVGDRQVPVRVRLPQGDRSSLQTVENMMIQTPSGRVRLKDLGKVELVPGDSQSSREDQRRLLNVTAGLEGIDLGTAIVRVRKALAETQLPAGVTAEIAGQFQSQQDSFRNLQVVLASSVLLVFVVMLFQFRSFRAPITILILMPLALFGAVVGLFVTGTALNVSSFMGVVMLAGIVVKNGILLLDRAQHSIESGSSIEGAVVEAGEHRLRPILMTTLTAILGLLPLAFGIGAGAEMQKPLAVAVVGGLAFSTFLTLLVGPVIYAALFPKGHT
ncbi:efflux RND transporter permease subunit [soil metagenome]